MSTMALTLNGIANNQVSALVSRSGKTVGTSVTFGGTLSATEIKAHLRAQDPTLKGVKLQEKVNAVLTGREAMAWAEHDVMVSAMRSAGYIPNKGDVRAKSGVMRYVKPTAPKSDKVTQEAALAALGVTAEEFAAMKALVAKSN